MIFVKNHLKIHTIYEISWFWAYFWDVFSQKSSRIMFFIGIFGSEGFCLTWALRTRSFSAKYIRTDFGIMVPEFFEKSTIVFCMRQNIDDLLWNQDRNIGPHRIFMKHEHLAQVTAPSSRGLGKLWDIILIRTRGDLANGGPLIRWEWPDARLFSRDIQKYFSFGQSRSM